MHFKALHSGSITLHLINEDNLLEVFKLLEGFVDTHAIIQEIKENYVPEFKDGLRTKFGFYALENNSICGLSLLGIDSYKECVGFTGADTLLHMRGKGIAPRSKPHLFYLGFEILNLNRLASGCLVSNIASKRSIEKTKGFQFEGVARKSGLNDKGEFEDQYIYSILKDDWKRLYTKADVTVIF